MDEITLAVQRMQDYIGQHLAEEITLAQLAGASMFSPWYSARIFKRLTGLPPAEYIRDLRLSRSALRLRDEGCLVTDAALDSGFGSIDGFRRAFMRRFGVNPGSYSEDPVPIPLFTPYGAKFRELWKETAVDKKTRCVFVQTVDKPARKALIKRGVAATEYWSYCQEVGCDVWGLLESIKSLDGEPVCLWLPKALRKPNTSEYVQGVELPID